MPRLLRSPIARLRAKKYATAREAATAFGCSEVHWRHVERGRANPSLSLMKRMAHKCDTSLRAVEQAVRAARRDLLKRTLENV